MVQLWQVQETTGAIKAPGEGTEDGQEVTMSLATARETSAWVMLTEFVLGENDSFPKFFCHTFIRGHIIFTSFFSDWSLE